MILVEAAQTGSIGDLKATLQRAVQLEFATLPPYLYAWYTAGSDNAPAHTRISAVVHEEMVHMMLVCNILNSLGTVPVIADASVVPMYPGPLPFSIGSDTDDPDHPKPFIVHLLHFSEAAMTQAAEIEMPEHPIDIMDSASLAVEDEPTFHTIGEFYAAVKAALPDTGWTGANQIDDSTAFAGELFKVESKADAEAAIDLIVSQGEGTDQGTDHSPLDFQGEVSHYYRFTEIERNQVLTKDPTVSVGYSWGAPLGVDFARAVNAIDNPSEHDFAGDEPAKAAQDACDLAFTEMLDELQRAVGGDPDRLGNAVQKMFDLSQAAYTAIATPLANSEQVAGPAFLYRPELLTPGG